MDNDLRLKIAFAGFGGYFFLVVLRGLVHVPLWAMIAGLVIAIPAAGALTVGTIGERAKV